MIHLTAWEDGEPEEYDIPAYTLNIRVSSFQNGKTIRLTLDNRSRPALWFAHLPTGTRISVRGETIRQSYTTLVGQELECAGDTALRIIYLDEIPEERNY